MSGRQAAAISVLPAEIVSVSGETCTIKIGELEITGVRLRAVINNNSEKILVTPKDGSHVLVADLSGGEFREFAVIAFSEVEKINIKIGATTIDVDSNGIIFNGGSLDGMVKINELTNKLNLLVQAFNGHSHQVSTTGSASAQTGMTTSLTPTAQTFSAADYKNEKIKQ